MIDKLPYRIKLDVPGFFKDYWPKSLQLTKAELARRTNTTRQLVQQQERIGKGMSRAWLVVLESHYEGSKADFWKLVKKHAL